jgi:L-alanine-DL-glutamate epimerase-like enolase superfamily enzyme
MKIASVEVYAVGATHEWNLYSDDEPLRSTLTICRIRTDDGTEGVGGVTQYSEHEFDHTTATHLTNHLAPRLLGRNPLMKEAIMDDLQPDVYPNAPHPFAAVDIALWDLLGNITGTPLYALLGGSVRCLPVQSSSPTFETIIQYLDWADEAIKRGCRAIKVHGFMDYKRDKELVVAMKGHVPGHVILSLDVENSYSFGEAIKMARLLESLDFDWFEAPLPDRDLSLYQELSRRTDIDILPGGNTIIELQRFTEAAARRSWDRARFDVTVCGEWAPSVASVHSKCSKCSSTSTSSISVHLY